MKSSIGKINLTKGRVVITDPCYDKGTWCSANLDNVVKGEWEAFINTVDGSNRIRSLTIEAVGQTASTFERLSNDIGVDAGVCGVFENKPDYDDDAWDEVCDELGFGNYGLATKDNAFHCVGVWSTSGYGDGSYFAVVGYNDGLEVVSITIYYIVDDEASTSAERDHSAKGKEDEASALSM